MPAHWPQQNNNYQYSNTVMHRRQTQQQQLPHRRSPPSVVHKYILTFLTKDSGSQNSGSHKMPVHVHMPSSACTKTSTTKCFNGHRSTSTIGTTVGLLVVCQAWPIIDTHMLQPNKLGANIDSLLAYHDLGTCSA